MNFDDFEKFLETYPAKDISFIGLGNEICGDDIAGLVFLDRLKETGVYKESQFIKAGTNPENYIGSILKGSSELVVFIDTAKTGAKAGSIKFFQSKEIKSSDISTHAYSITMVEDFLNKFRPIKFFYLGIEPYCTEIGQGISSCVSDAMDDFFRIIAD